MARIRREDLVARSYQVALGGIVLFATIAVAFGAYLFRDHGKLTDHRKDWKSFYEDYYKNTFFVPANAEIVRADYFEDSCCGGYSKVAFRLPNKRPPEAWLKTIEKESRYFEGEPAGPLCLESKDEGSAWTIAYDPTSRIFHAQRYW